MLRKIGVLGAALVVTMAAVASAAPSGLYTGKTSQKLNIAVKVSKGHVVKVSYVAEYASCGEFDGSDTVKIAIKGNKFNATVHPNSESVDKLSGTFTRSEGQRRAQLHGHHGRDPSDDVPQRQGDVQREALNSRRCARPVERRGIAFTSGPRNRAPGALRIGPRCRGRQRADRPSRSQPTRDSPDFSGGLTGAASGDPVRLPQPLAFRAT